jgi:UDP-glucuronate 4-epimerase
MNLRMPSSLRSFLVTGGAGFIGSHVVDYLLASGADRVVVVDDFNDYYDPRLKWRNVEGHLHNSRYRLVVADIRDRDRLAQLMREECFDSVIHLAARAGVRPSLTDARLYQQVNVEGTLNLLELAKSHDWKSFVLASSSSVYGAQALPPFREDAPLLPVSPYAATKAACELITHSYSQLYGLRAVCLRFFTVYGPRQRPDLAIHKFVSAVLKNQSLPVYGDGTSRRDYTHIADIVQGIASAIEYTVNGATAFEVINLGESQCITLHRLIELIELATGQKALLENHSSQSGDVPLTHADISKAKALLNYRPSMPIEKGIVEFVQWMRHLQTFKAAA